MADRANVTLFREDAIAVLALDRPPANAMNLELLGELVEALEELQSDPPPALVLAGRDPFFSGGVDLKAVPGYGPAEHEQMVTGINRMVTIAYALPCPVVAAVTGHAIAGGLVLALCADYRIASSGGRYGLTEVKVGVPYPQAAIGVVRAELSPAAARQLVLTNRLIDAGAGVALGIFDEAAAPDEVRRRAVELAGEMAAFSGPIYASTKEQLRGGILAAMRTAVAAEPLLGSGQD